MNLPIIFQLGSFSFSNGSPEDLKNAIVAGLRAIIDGDNILLGKVGGATPTDGTTLWFKGSPDGSFYYLEGSTYRPVKIRVGTSTASVSFASTPIANRVQTLQDKDGTIALLSDISTPLPTKILTTAGHGINWAVSTSFYYQMDVTTASMPFSNSLPGQIINLIIYTPTNDKTVTFDSNINWVGGGGQPAATSPGTDRWEFRNIAGQVYGSRFAAYA